jgi:hypothetical protein
MLDPTTYDEMILYYRLMAKWSGLDDSTIFSRAVLSQLSFSIMGKRTSTKGFSKKAPVGEGALHLHHPDTSKPQLQLRHQRLLLATPAPLLHSTN